METGPVLWVDAVDVANASGEKVNAKGDDLLALFWAFNANDKTVTWVSSDESVVTVDGGVLTPVGAGTAKVSARTSNYVSDEGTPNLFKSVNVTVSQADYRKVTFTPTSATTTQQSLDYLSGGSATISGSGTYDNTKQYIQFAQNKSGTFTINGYAGAKIVGIELFMCSNGNAGAGGLSVVAGATTLHTIESCSFDNIAWYGAFSANPVELYYDVTDYQMQANETITFAFNGTVNSLFVYGISLRYTVNTLEEWCQDFLDNYACNAAGTSAPSTAEWTKFNTKYGVLSAAEKIAAAEAEASESGTLLERAMAKYDYIVGKYNKAQHLTAYNDYIGRNPLPIGGTPRFGSTIFNETNAIIAIAVIASMIGIAFVGSYLLIKRRKEN